MYGSVPLLLSSPCDRGAEPGDDIPGGGFHLAERGGRGRDQELRAEEETQSDEEGAPAKGMKTHSSVGGGCFCHCHRSRMSLRGHLMR
jgi:hypothetical protein